MEAVLVAAVTFQVKRLRGWDKCCVVEVCCSFKFIKALALLRLY